MAVREGAATVGGGRRTVRWAGRWRRFIRGPGAGAARLALLAACLALPAPASASFVFQMSEIAQAHGLRARILDPDRVPGLAEAMDPAAPGPLPAGTAARLLQGLRLLARAEGENPFFHWAVGEVRRRSEDAGGANDFTRALEVAGNRPVIHWLLWETYLANDQYVEADRELGALQTIAVGWGLIQFPAISERLVREARVAQGHGSFQKAVWLLERAIESDPTAPEPHLLMAQVLWRQQRGSRAAALRSLAGGALLAVQSGETGLRIRGAALGNLIHAIQLVAIALAAILLLRCARLVLHDIGHAGGARLGTGALLAIMVAVAVPVGLLLGHFWSALAVLALCAPYLRARERVLVSAAILALCALPFLYRAAARTHLVADSPRVTVAELVQAGARGEGVVDLVQRWANEERAAYVPAYLLGLLHKRRGDLTAAEQELQRAARLAPHRPPPWVALGTVRYLRGDVDGALEAFTKAATLPVESAMAHRDLGLISFERFALDRGRAELEEAFRLDPRLASTVFAPRGGRAAGGSPADDRLRANELWAALAPGSEQIEEVASSFWARTLGGVPLRGVPVAAAAAFLAFWFLAAWGPRRFRARACQRCGKVYCARCDQAGPLCAACTATVRRTQGIGTLLMLRKLPYAAAVPKRLRRAARLLAILLPGAGHVYLGRLVVGLVLLFATFFLLPQLLGAGPFWLHLGTAGQALWLHVAVGLVLLGLVAFSALRCALLTRAGGG